MILKATRNCSNSGFNLIFNRLKLVLLLVLCCYSKKLCSQTDSIQYSFFIAGHCSGAPGQNNIGFYQPFKSKLNEKIPNSKIEFGVLTGDIVSPNPIEQDWIEIDAEIDTLGMPVYFVVGNHDMENRPVYENRYGSTYYHFLKNGDLYIVLDPNISNWNISNEQLSFVSNLLRTHSNHVNNVFVFFHQLIWIENDNIFSKVRVNSFTGKSGKVNFWEEFIPLFDKIKNQVYMIAGDVGAGIWSDDAMYYDFRKITLIASGMGEGIGDNFLIANVWSSKKVTFEMVPVFDSDSLIVRELLDYSIDQPPLSLEVYPSPTSKSLKIKFSNLDSYSSIYIYNIQGEIMYESDEYCSSIDVSLFPEGLYVIKLKYNDAIYHRKFVKDGFN